MVGFLIEHNLPLSAADHLSSLFPAMFPDSKIATKFSCRRTKSTAIVHTMAEDVQSDISERMRCNLFSISTDGSADRGGKNQLYPIVTRYYNKDEGRVLTGTLTLPACTDICSTGENIFNLVDGELNKYRLSWKHCMSFCSDNAAVMMGHKKGVAAFVTGKNENTFINGCACHLIHLAARKASSMLNTKVDELLIDIFYYLDKSSKRHKTLKEFQGLHGADVSSILKHCTTRWLSLSVCITRLLEQWGPLTHFFEVECQKLQKSAPKKRKADPPAANPPAKKVNANTPVAQKTVGTKNTSKKNDEASTLPRSRSASKPAPHHKKSATVEPPSNTGASAVVKGASAVVQVSSQVCYIMLNSGIFTNNLKFYSLCSTAGIL
jgi:hypothetical protein